MAETGREVMGLPVETGMPVEFEASTELVRQPEYATAVGLLILGSTHSAEGGSRQGGRITEVIAGKLKRFLSRLR